MSLSLSLLGYLLNVIGITILARMYLVTIAYLLYRWVHTRLILIYAIDFPLRVCASYRCLLSCRGPNWELGSAGSGRVLLLMLASLIEGVW